MGDPERLLKSGSSDPEVRELLESLRGISPGSGTGLSSWSVMAAKVAALPTVVPALGSAPAAPTGSVASSGIAASASKAVGLKLLAVALASTVVGVGAYWAHSTDLRRNQAASAVAPSGAPASASHGVAAPAPAASETAPAPASVPPSNVLPPAGAPARLSRLEAEASLLARVRSELRSGDAHAALASLNQLQTQFPKGQLGQERDVLAVEVLAANGNTSAAKRKARAFIAAHPSSPLSAKLERFAETP